MNWKLKMCHTWVILLTLYLAVVTNNYAEADDGAFRFASYYSDNMILQRKPASPKVWGWHKLSAVGQTVTVTIRNNQIHEATVNIAPDGNAGIWEVQLTPPDNNDAHSIYAMFGNTTIRITNVKFGDVWFCAGQSNMEFHIVGIFNHYDVYDLMKNHTDVRIYATGQNTSAYPLNEPIHISRQWAIPDGPNAWNFSAVCYLFGMQLNDKLNVPIGLVLSAWHGTRIEAWSTPEANEKCVPHGIPPPRGEENVKSALYNSLVHPYFKMSIKGAIWYQGEANVNRSSTYACSEQAMINSWRKNWFQQTDGSTNESFPFGFVQLAPKFKGGVGHTADLRWAQTYSHGFVSNSDLHNVFMAVAIDLPDFDAPGTGLHPRYKRPIAHRLALGAFKVAYGLTDTGRYQGPFPTSLKRTHLTMDIVFDHGKSELVYKNDIGFEICCSADPFTFCPGEGTSWNKTFMVSQGKSSISLDLTGVCYPGQIQMGVRYLWGESPCEQVGRCTVYSKQNHLPAAPFIFNGLF